MRFEDLEAWQQARLLVSDIYTLTRGDVALRSDFGLSGQVQRAATSIMSNLAEGFERRHLAEKLQAYNIDRSSCGEVRSLLYVIEDNYSASALRAVELRQATDTAGKLITGLIQSTERRR